MIAHSTRILAGLMLLMAGGCTHAPADTVFISTAPVLTENQKIEALIAIVAETHDAQFIRKGTSYDCATAAKFMRGKWNWKSGEIKTARDFVRVCSAGGSGEGTPYYLRYADGKQVTSKQFLSEALDRLEAPIPAQ